MFRAVLDEVYAHIGGTQVKLEVEIGSCH